MNQYLTPEQRARFERELAGASLTDEQKQAAFEQGRDMARADLAGEAPDSDAAVLEGSGFDSVSALLEAYQASQARLNEATEALRRLNALVRVLENGNALEPEKPEERTVRVQKAWKGSAAGMRDLEALLPEIAEYILAHPEYSIEEDGLERAYNAVRAAKYRSDEELLGDPESVKRLAADPRVRNAVLVAHLAEVYKSGRELPAFIADGGSIPAAAGKSEGGMQQAKAKLEALLKK
ncbi:MAG: hypothetical protein J5998_03480 [Clostridia bacterium]|nr:hypothetical protein [Clostridia bacterium]